MDTDFRVSGRWRSNKEDDEPAENTEMIEKLRRRWLNFRVLKCFLPIIEERQHEECIGCKYEHPSQRYHSCLGLGVSSITGQPSHPVDDYNHYLWVDEPKLQDIDSVLGSMMDDPRDQVKTWEDEQRWREDVEKALKKFWTVVPGFKTALIKRKDEFVEQKEDPIRQWMDDLPKKKKRWSLDQMDINVMSGKLGEGWECIGRHLGIREARISQAKMSHPNSARMQIFTVFNHWRQKHGNRADLMTFLEACHVSEALVDWDEVKKYVESLEIID